MELGEATALIHSFPYDEEQHQKSKPDLVRPRRSSLSKSMRLALSRFKRQQKVRSRIFAPGTLGPTRPESTELSSSAHGGFFLWNLMFAQIGSKSSEQQLLGTRSLRRVLLQDETSSVLERLDSQVLSLLTSFLLRFYEPDLQREAAWCLATLSSTSSDFIARVVKANAIQNLTQVLGTEHVARQATWCLGNIAAESAKFRDLVIQNKAMPLLLQNLRPDAEASMFRTTVWTISNICKVKPIPPIEELTDALVILTKLLHHSDNEILTDALVAVSSISDAQGGGTQALIATGAVPRLVELLGHEDRSILTYALRSTGNIATGKDSETQTVIDAGLFSKLPRLLVMEHVRLRREATWTLSNITAGNVHQIEEAMASGVMQLIIDRMGGETQSVKAEICWVLSNATMRGSQEQITRLVEIGCCEALSVFLEFAGYNEPPGLLPSEASHVGLSCLNRIANTGRRIAKLSNTDKYNVFQDELTALAIWPRLLQLAEDRQDLHALSIVKFTLAPASPWTDFRVRQSLRKSIKKLTTSKGFKLILPCYS